MTRAHRLLLLAVVLEIAAGSALVAHRCARPRPPGPDLARLPSATAADILRLQHAAGRDHGPEWRELGEALMAYGYFVEAECCLRRAVALDAADSPAKYARAYALDRAGRLDDAQALFENLARASDGETSRNCWYHVGLLHLRGENAAAAETAFLHVSEYPAPDFQRARLLIRQGRAAEALPAVARLEHGFPRDLNVQLLAYHAERALGHQRAARDHAACAERGEARLRLADHLDYLDPIRRRYGLQKEIKRFDEAFTTGRIQALVAQFEEMFRRNDPEDILRFLDEGAAFALQGGRPKLAQEALQTLAERTSPGPGVQHVVGDAWFALGDRERAREIWEKANRLRPRAESHLALADLFEQAGDDARANHERGLGRQVAGIDAYRQDRLEAARELLEESVALAPGESRSWYYLGEIHRAQRSDDDARAAYERCVALDPDHGRALDRLAEADDR